MLTIIYDVFSNEPRAAGVFCARRSGLAPNPLYGKPLPYRLRVMPKIHRVGFNMPHLDWYQYYIQNVETRRVFIHEQQFASHGEFYKAMAQWNSSQPRRWNYWECVIHNSARPQRELA